MSLTEKVIKNTYYFTFSQITTLLIPFILAPLIISIIGEVQFGIYAIILGVTTSFGIFDLSISSSFVKFISEYYYKKDFIQLNRTINTGFLFYLSFAILFCLAGFVAGRSILLLINIPQDLTELSVKALYLALFIFFFNNAFSIFTSVLISIQKMYAVGLTTIIVNLLNFLLTIILLKAGHGLMGILLSQLISAMINSIVIFILSKKNLQQLKFSVQYFSKSSILEMGKFGFQMQISKLAGFFSEKYDEFLLGFFSVLNNVTFFNISARILRFVRFFPMQLIIQIAPLAAEFNAKEDKEKLSRLFDDAVKYLTLASLPLSIYTFVFAEEIIYTWMGGGFILSAYILRILIIGQLINLIISSPGNSILPNIGIPKYQMYEGLIHLVINVIFSYILIKYYGVLGAAYGNSSATILSSLFIFITTIYYFKKSALLIFIKNYSYPLLTGISLGVLFFYANKIYIYNGYSISSRYYGIIFLLLSGFLYFAFFVFFILNSNYLTLKNKKIFSNIILKLIPSRFIPSGSYIVKTYQNEKVSIFILTYNKIELLKKCLNGLMKTLKNINYELIIWNNNSDDGTEQYLRENYDNNSNIQIINHNENIGNKAKSRAAEICTGDFIIGIDDDIIEFPENWVEQFVKAYKTIPYAGYLSTDVIQDEKTNGAKYHEERYKNFEIQPGLILQSGPSGGWCFMISREVYNEVGKLLYLKNKKFITEDGDYQLRALNRGFNTGIVKDLKVYHATGEYYNQIYGNPLEVKYKEAIEPLPLLYVIKRKILSMFAIKGKIRKIAAIANDNYYY